MAPAREKFATQARTELLAAVRELAEKEGRQDRFAELYKKLSK